MRMASGMTLMESYFIKTCRAEKPQSRFSLICFFFPEILSFHYNISFLTTISANELIFLILHGEIGILNIAWLRTHLEGMCDAMFNQLYCSHVLNLCRPKVA